MERVVPGGLGPATIAMTEPGGFARAIASAEPSLRRFLRQRGVGSSDLDDILQATWLIAWQHRREFAGRGSASGWLLAIARTAHRNWRQSTPCLIDELNDRIAAPLPAAESEDIERARLADQRVRLLAALTPRQRSMLVSRFLLDQSVDTVAISHGCRRGTVKATVHKAIKWLRAHDPARGRTDG